MSIEEASVPLAAIENLRKGHWASFDRAIQSVGRDVTARFEEEKALRQRLREFEG